MKNDDNDSIKAGVQQVVQELYDQTGAVKPGALVEAARPKESPAHPGFTWNDKKAAEQYRLEEARRWIRVVVVKPAPDEQAERMVHVPVVVQQEAEAPKSKEGEYKPISIVAESADEYVRARNEVLAKGRAFAAALAELDHAAAKRGKADMSAVIAQISRGLDLFEQAIETLH